MKKAKKTIPSIEELHLQLIHVYEEEGEISKEAAQLLLLLADAYMEEKAFTEAAEYYTQAGTIWLELTHPAKAIAVFEKGIEILSAHSASLPELKNLKTFLKQAKKIQEKPIIA